MLTSRLGLAAATATVAALLAWTPLAQAEELTSAERQAVRQALAAASAQRSSRDVTLMVDWNLEGSSTSMYGATKVRPPVFANEPTMPELSAYQQWLVRISQLPECQGDLAASEECRVPPADPANPASARPPLAAVRALAREVVLSLQLPDATPHIGPDPSVNEWNMAVVGYPLWLWTEGPRTLSTTRTAYGVTFTLTATQTSTYFTLGDGHSLTCATTQPYPAGTTPGTPSPSCGYRYQKASLPHGTYTVSATTGWSVQWAALGYTGTLPTSLTASRSLPVGELHTVITR